MVAPGPGATLLALGAALAAWVLTRRYGWRAGLAIPGLAAGAALVAAWTPLDRAEPGMGQGPAFLFLWLPLVTLTLAGAVLGLIARRKAARDRRR